MDGDPAVEPELDTFSLIFPLPYRVAIIIVLGVWAWGLNLYYLSLIKIDVPGLIKYPSRPSLPPQHRRIYRVAATATIPLVASILLFWIITHGSPSLVIAWEILPQSYLFLLIIIFIIPFQQLSRTGRYWFLSILKRVSIGRIAEAHDGKFGDILLADVLTSYAKVLGDLFISACMFLSFGTSSTNKPDRNCGGQIIVPLIISIPSMIRLRQCLIEYSRVKKGPKSASSGWGGQHLANALKYSTAFPVIILSALQRGYDPTKIGMTETGLFRLWLFFVFVNSFYSFYWDVAKDWDLTLFSASDERDNPEHPWGLRRHMHFHTKEIYYVAIIIDLTLRCTWSLKLSPHLDHFNDLEGGIFAMEFLEVFRRFIWIFFRVETEWTRPKITITLSATRGSGDGSSVSDKHSLSTSVVAFDDEPPYTVPSPESQPPTPSSLPSLSPPPFSSLYFPPPSSPDSFRTALVEPDQPPDFCPGPSVEAAEAIEVDNTAATSFATTVEAETKAALPKDTKGESSHKGAEEGEPPPPYTEGSSPLDSFTYLMAATGGPTSIITQVQQGGGPPLNTLADVGADEQITLDLRGTRFVLSRDELLTLPEFVLLSLFPNGLLPDGQSNTFHDGDIYPVDYDPGSLQYMLDFFRNVAQTIPSSSSSPVASTDNPTSSEAAPGSARDMLHDRAGIIVLREDLDFYAIPPKAEIDQPEMIEVKRAAGKALLRQDGIFSGLRRSEESGTTEQHLIEMLTAGGFQHNDSWGHRASEPNKAVICSLALARLRTDIRGSDLANSSTFGMAQKLLLFWRKPARRCWWEGVELENVDGVEGKLKVWIRRVWTLEMSVIGLR